MQGRKRKSMLYSSICIVNPKQSAEALSPVLSVAAMFFKGGTKLKEGKFAKALIIQVRVVRSIGT